MMGAIVWLSWFDRANVRACAVQHGVDMTPLARDQSRAMSRTSTTPDAELPPVMLPPLRWPSADHLTADGVFLLEAAAGIWVRFGEEVSPMILFELFEVHSMTELPMVRARAAPHCVRTTASATTLSDVLCFDAVWRHRSR
jgi:hypothetical protein